MKSKMIIVVLLLAMVLCFAMGCNLPIENEVSDGTLDKVTKFQQIDNSTDFSKYFDQNEWAEYILNDDDVITAIVMTGEKSLADVSADIKLATRHYAKRQLIWFRRYNDVIRLVPDEGGIIKSSAQLADEALLYIVSK